MSEQPHDTEPVTIVLATRNQGKVRELAEPLRAFGLRVVGLDAFPDLPEVEETGTTFEENALLKAREVSKRTGLVAIADDSGLEVDALNGAPGVYSARYGSAEYFAYAEKHGLKVGLEPLPPHADDQARTLRLLRNMAAVPDGKRQARFVSAVACVFPDGREFTVRGACEGEIARRMHGAGGFGYDPVFYVPAYGMTFGELAPADKNRISHRGIALRKCREKLKAYL